MQKLLAALGDDIKPAGKNWIARCRVHNDKDFAMSIKQAADNSVLAHCFACGANGLDLYRALGLDLKELFGDKELERGHVPHQIREQYETDKLVIAIYNADKSANKYVSLADSRRYKLAMARSEGVKSKFNIEG